MGQMVATTKQHLSCGIEAADSFRKILCCKCFDIETRNAYISPPLGLLNDPFTILNWTTNRHLTGYLTQDPIQVDEINRRMVSVL